MSNVVRLTLQERSVPDPYVEFCHARQHFIRSWQLWIATNPPQHLIELEWEGTQSVLRQMHELLEARYA